MTIDPSKSALENAYNLWKAGAHEELSDTVPDPIKRITAIHSITNKLFLSMKQNKWYSGILAFFKRLTKASVLRDVKRALAAYKFDLVTSSKESLKEAWLFSDHEKAFIKELRPLFRKTLLHKAVTTVSGKAKRWNMKTKKYKENPHFLLASAGLTAVADSLPYTKSLINRVIKPFGPQQIQGTVNWMLVDLDPAVKQGLNNLLGREDFTFNVPFKTVLKQAAYEIGREKIKRVKAYTFETCAYYYQAAKTKAYNAALRVRDILYYPFITKEG